MPFGRDTVPGMVWNPGANVPVGRVPSNVPKGDETRATKVGMEALKVPVIFVNKLYE